MKTLRWIIVSVLLVLVSLLVYNRITIHAASAAWSNQKWGELPDGPKVVALKPGQWMRFGPFAATVGSFRYDVNSSMPINTGLVQPNGTWPETATCYEGQVFNAVKSCGVGPASQQYIFIADTRTAGDIIGGALLGNKTVIQDNRVTITAYHWGCVADCVK